MPFKSRLRTIKNQFFIFSILYFLVSVLEIIGDTFNQNELVYLTKPLLMPLLILLFYQTWRSQKDTKSKLLIGALFFAFIGDVALMLVSINDNFFLVGLGAFLITQLLYFILFTKTRIPKIALIKPNRILILLMFLGFYISLMSVLFQHLNELLVPVIIYGGVVCLMGYASTIRNTNNASYLLVLIGACLFILSDSLIALDKFIDSVNILYPQFYIMLLYILAQYLIVVGIIKSYRT